MSTEMQFLVTLEKDEDGFIVAECPPLPGCPSQGKTRDEALANIREVIEGYLASSASTASPSTRVWRSQRKRFPP